MFKTPYRFSRSYSVCCPDAKRQPRVLNNAWFHLSARQEPVLWFCVSVARACCQYDRSQSWDVAYNDDDVDDDDDDDDDDVRF